MEQPVTAVYDANILYPALVRDLFIRLAQADLVRARWTETIHDEWIRSVLKDNPHISASRLARTRAKMNASLRDCLVTGYEHLIPSLKLPDPDDRHVLAAGIHGEADVIVTCNLGDFPAAILSAYGIEAVHPDEFAASLFERAPDSVCAAVKRQRASLTNPPKSVSEFLATLDRHGLRKTAALLAQLAEHI